jgi:hypothetical protein
MHQENESCKIDARRICRFIGTVGTIRAPERNCVSLHRASRHVGTDLNRPDQDAHYPRFSKHSGLESMLSEAIFVSEPIRLALCALATGRDVLT